MHRQPPQRRFGTCVLPSATCDLSSPWGCAHAVCNAKDQITSFRPTFGQLKDPAPEARRFGTGAMSRSHFCPSRTGFEYPARVLPAARGTGPASCAAFACKSPVCPAIALRNGAEAGDEVLGKLAALIACHQQSIETNTEDAERSHTTRLKRAAPHARSRSGSDQALPLKVKWR